MDKKAYIIALALQIQIKEEIYRADREFSYFAYPDNALKAAKELVAKMDAYLELHPEI